jgi:hypothetical protein
MMTRGVEEEMRGSQGDGGIQEARKSPGGVGGRGELDEIDGSETTLKSNKGRRGEEVEKKSKTRRRLVYDGRHLDIPGVGRASKEILVVWVQMPRFWRCHPWSPGQLAGARGADQEPASDSGRNQ